MRSFSALTHYSNKEEAQVPETDIERAIKRKQLFEENPEAHTYVEEEEKDGEDF